jgi:hypothetical protein
MSITKWAAVGCIVTLGSSVLTTGAALAGDASADAAAARASRGGSMNTPDPGGRDEQASLGVGSKTEVVALGASDGAADRPTANAYEAASVPLAGPTGSTARAAGPSGPLGAGDASSEAFVARAPPVRVLGAESPSYVRLSGVRNRP